MKGFPDDVIVLFINHWKVGVVPPLVGLAVNVTLPPHTVVALALALTEAVNDPVIVIVTPKDVAGLPVIQEIDPPDVVIVALTISLLAGV